MNNISFAAAASTLTLFSLSAFTSSKICLGDAATTCWDRCSSMYANVIPHIRISAKAYSHIIRGIFANNSCGQGLRWNHPQRIHWYYSSSDYMPLNVCDSDCVCVCVCACTEFGPGARDPPSRRNDSKWDWNTYKYWVPMECLAEEHRSV